MIVVDLEIVVEYRGRAIPVFTVDEAIRSTCGSLGKGGGGRLQENQPPSWILADHKMPVLG